MWNQKNSKGARNEERYEHWNVDSDENHVQVVVEDKGRQMMGSGFDKDLVEMCWRSILALGTSFVRYPISVNYTKDPN